MPVISTGKLILILLTSTIGIFAAWYLLKKFVPWMQKYSDFKQKKDLEAARQKMAEDVRESNEESDILRKIDGRDT